MHAALSVSITIPCLTALLFCSSSSSSDCLNRYPRRSSSCKLSSKATRYQDVHDNQWVNLDFIVTTLYGVCHTAPSTIYWSYYTWQGVNRLHPPPEFLPILPSYEASEWRALPALTAALTVIYSKSHGRPPCRGYSLGIQLFLF